MGSIATVSYPLLLGGLLGSFHCVGMCGGFVLALHRPGAGRLRRFVRPAAFLLGKAATYVMLGGLAGLFGGALVRSGTFGAAQAVLAVIAGTFLVVAGLQLSGLVPEWPVSSWFGPRSPWGRAAEAVSRAPGPAGPFAVGALAGLLPCPLVYGFLAAALAAGGILPAMGTMALLGLASLPALALVAVVGASVSPIVRRRFVRVSGVVLVLLGAVTLLRGLAPDALHAVFGHAGHG